MQIILPQSFASAKELLGVCRGRALRQNNEALQSSPPAATIITRTPKHVPGRRLGFASQEVCPSGSTCAHLECEGVR